MADEEYLEEEYLEDAPGEETWQDEMLKRTPWWAISVAFHIIVLLVLWVIKIGIIPTAEQEIIIEARIEEKEEPEYDPEKERDIIKRDSPLLDADVVADVPVVVTEDFEIDDHFETDDDMDLESAKGFEDAVGFVDAGSTGIVSSIGVGGGGRGGRFGTRFGGGRRNCVAAYGGKGTESAVDAALRWLMRHQSPDGAWHPDTWSQECPAGDSCVGKGGGAECDVGGDYPAAISGLAVLAFLGAGHTHTAGNFRNTVKRGVEYLQKCQQQNGKLEGGNGTRMYTHGIASLALVEAYGMTQSAKLKGSAQSAIDYIVYCQNPLGGWNYSSPSARNDMSITGWVCMALKSAKIGGLAVPQPTITRTVRWLEIATSGDDYSGDVAYSISGTDPNKEYKGGGGGIRMRAAGMLGFMFFGADPGGQRMTNSGSKFLKSLPKWAPAPQSIGHPNEIHDTDLYYWYYTTLVMFQLGGRYWKGWNEAMKTALLQNQIKGGHADGSWPPVDRFSARWSRPGITALCALCLEVYYRYMPVYMGR